LVVAVTLIDVEAIEAIARVSRVACARVASVRVLALSIPIALMVALALVNIRTLLTAATVSVVAAANERTRCVAARGLWGAVVAAVITFVDIVAMIAIAAPA
jgi:hypothetical protein